MLLCSVLGNRSTHTHRKDETVKHEPDHPAVRERERRLAVVKDELDTLLASRHDELITEDDFQRLSARLIKPWGEYAREELLSHIKSWAVRTTER
jgi:hypothetical protein